MSTQYKIVSNACKNYTFIYNIYLCPSNKILHIHIELYSFTLHQKITNSYIIDVLPMLKIIKQLQHKYSSMLKNIEHIRYKYYSMPQTILSNSQKYKTFLTMIFSNAQKI